MDPLITTLRSAPNLAALYGRAVLTGLTRRGGGELPDTGYRLAGVTVDRAHLADYDRVCGLRHCDELPPTYPQILSFPLQVKLMTDPGFPFPLVGSVHLANRITWTRPLHAGERLDIRVRVADLRPHPKGRQFDMITEVCTGDEPVCTAVSTYLRRGAGSGDGGDARPEPGPAPEPTAVWRVPADTGRRYAEVSGDRNPIHLHPLTARPFGFRRAIAHGMWTKARCLAAFEGRLPDAGTIEVRFKLPVLLPATVGFTARPTGSGHAFQVFDARTGRPHLAGELSRLP
ncbi:MAG TPA: MaoC/PaaZ C-terminal domain-containing protein [Actinophytocola sp.]|uniref:MaoC/PaaZ C-terminal domain-containing protein n=1 Tax=Actinophytocola sp. TaxID=1872138 RepID=UPI002DBB5CFB|nr:MaoC/PaaZ C-terminal domain-containing protein [Actinophytocola sp.]HEU5473042.1 MaoC/PaaZ C-terminal domain-containing protein [Actinophytocola sp.]